MTDQVGPRQYECNPGTKLWRPPVKVTQFWRPRSGFDARFLKDQKKIILIKRQGNSMKQQLLEMIQVTVRPHTDEFIFVLKTKN